MTIEVLQVVPESFAKVVFFFFFPRKTATERKASRKAGESFVKDNFFFREEWPFCLERILIKSSYHDLLQ